MRKVLVSLLFVSCGALAADDLSDADKFLAAKEYGKALPLYTKLANAGNVVAQFRLGEMYWFGDGTPPDLEAARRWFEKAAASGNGDAKASLAALDRRKIRGNEIVFWTEEYDGADLRSGQYECKTPLISEVSKTNEDVAATRKAIETWQTCYDGFVGHFNATVSGGKHIPADVLDMMTPQEADLALARVKTVYTKVLAAAQADADRIQARQLAWETATEAFVKEENLRIARENEEKKRLAIEFQRREAMDRSNNDRSVPRGPSRR